MFAVLHAHRDLRNKKRGEFFYDLIGVLCAPHADQKYLDAVRSMWKQIRDESIPEFKQESVSWNDGTPRVPWKQATQIMLQQMAVMAKCASNKVVM